MYAIVLPSGDHSQLQHKKPRPRVFGYGPLVAAVRVRHDELCSVARDKALEE
jgi:hypothetical protein